MKLAHILIGGGFTICVLAFFPLSASQWLSREVQLLIGSMALIAGICLVEVEGWMRDR
jgi:hypothetical protein